MITVIAIKVLCNIDSGHIEYSVPLAMTQYLKKDNHLIPWDTAYDKISTMGRLLVDTPTYPHFRKVFYTENAKKFQKGTQLAIF